MITPYGSLKLVFFLLLLIIGTSIINFINFMDGIDGLVAGCMLIIFLLTSIILSNWQLFFVGSLLGFLFWNWYPSKVFMGDAGSTFLGALFFGLLLDSSNFIQFLKIFIISFPLIGDAFVCVVRRFLNKQKIFKAHSSHLYQRLCQSGWNHSSVAILYMICIFTLSISMIVGDLRVMIYLFLIQIFIGVYLDQKFAKPFSETIE